MNYNLKELESKKIEEMEKCNHLFVKLKEGVEYSGFHSSDYGNDPHIVSCLHCGLTNKYIETDEINKKYDVILRLRFPIYNCFVETNNKVFKKQFSFAWRRCGKSFDNSVFNLISDEVLKSNHTKILYDLALKISPDGKNDEIFNIMKDLNEIETPIEKKEISSINQTSELFDRYMSMRKALIYEKK